MLKTESKPEPAVSKAASVAIDYPRPNEKVMPGHYAIRITSTCETPVMVSIDGGEFAHCRQDAGFWWFDWQATPGRHSVVARTGGAAETRARRFEVVSNGNRSH